MPNAVEWLNENALRAFPFKENSSRSDGTVTIPNYLIVDMAFVVPVDVSDTFYIKTLMVSTPQVTGVIANQNGNNVGTFSIPLDTHEENDSYAIAGSGAYPDARGRIVSGSLANLLDDIPEGVYNFELDATPLEVSAVRPDLRRIRGVKIQKADGTVSEVITGVLQLTSGTNIILENPSTGVIKINAVGNEDFIEECGDCLNQFAPPEPIRTINGVGGDAEGNLDLVSLEACLTIAPDSGNNAVNFTDTCSQPCCGCTELEFLTTALSTLRDSIAKLERIAEDLQTRQTEFFQNVLSSI